MYMSNKGIVVTGDWKHFVSLMLVLEAYTNIRWASGRRPTTRNNERQNTGAGWYTNDSDLALYISINGNGIGEMRYHAYNERLADKDWPVISALDLIELIHNHARG